MARTNTTNLNLVQPDRLDQYNVDDFNSNMEKIDNFAGLVPPRALTADKLTVGRNINGVLFDGTKSVITGLGLHSMSEIYAMNNIAYTVEDGKVKLHKSLQDQNQGHATSEVDWWEEVKLGGGNGMPIGSIVPFMVSNDITPEGFIKPDNTEYTADLFPDLWEYYLQPNIELRNKTYLNTCTYEEQEQEILEKGYSTKFAVNMDTRTFKVPLLNEEYTKFAMQVSGEAPVKGNGNILGLTDGTAEVGLTGRIYNAAAAQVEYTSLPKPIGTTSSGSIYTSSKYLAIPTDPAKSGMVADLSNVTTDGVKLRWFIYIANAQLNESAINWDYYMSSLQNKADINLGNVNQQGKEFISGMGMPSDKYIDLSLGTSGSTYIAPANGYYALQKNGLAGQFNYMENSTTGFTAYNGVVSNGTNANVSIFARKNDEVKVYYTTNVAANIFRFYYTEGSK